MQEHSSKRSKPAKTSGNRRRQKPATDSTKMKPLTSDQAPGEETVQVNDQYVGGGAPPAKKPSEHDQHQTGG